MTAIQRSSQPAAFAAAIILFFAANSLSVQKGLVGLDFAELMKVKVSSVERREKSWQETPAAITILTADNIRRSGANTIPDLLRYVPGLTVARTNGNSWAVSARGGLDPISNKLLVLVDGRSVYTPLFSGVFWDALDFPLESIERIEIIRGPGGSVWGVNAVNGVINIIRKTPARQAGTMVSVGGGNEERFNGNVTTGKVISKKASFSAYGRYREFDGLQFPDGSDARDQGKQGGGGFRLDGKTGDKATWSVSGDSFAGEFYENGIAATFIPPANVAVHDETNVNGNNVMAKWGQEMGVAGSVAVQAYYDRTSRNVERRFSEIRNTWDVVAQHQFRLGRIHRLTYGAGFRSSHDDVGNTVTISFLPKSQTDNITNLFLQDEMQLRRNLTLNVGTKFERNDYTGWEVQPSARTSWEVRPGQSVWSAVSRAVRTPSRIDRDLSSQSVAVPVPLITTSFKGSDDFVSERLTAYEAGYRGQPAKNWIVALSGFVYDYSHLRGVSVLAPRLESDPPPLHTVIPFVLTNNLRGESFGGELVQRIRLADGWSIRAAYSYLHQRLHVVGNLPDANLALRETADPAHQVFVRSSWNVGRRVELDAGLRWVDELPAIAVDDYTAIDARASWRASEVLTVELSGQNLFETAHREFSPGNEVEQAYFAKTIWAFR